MKSILLRMGELFLKGENRCIFENILITNIRKKLEGLNYTLERTRGRVLISNYDNRSEIIERLRNVFGLVSLSEAEEMDAEVETIRSYFKKMKVDGTFKVEVNRADKRFPISSMEFAAMLGGDVLDTNPNASVELYHPQTLIRVDIRSNKKAYVFDKSLPCQGGLPLGSSGKALLLLSGGIDSPVAGYMMAKRGLKLQALHFYSYPYTSQQAKQKVISLAKILCDYVDEIKLHCVSFTKVQEEIHANCAAEYMVTLMRRIMMRIAEIISKRENLGAIVTGESLGQVASQTMQGMTVTEDALESLPLFRPCIGMDKEDIVKISKEIGAFETSILPYEDCCTVFLPKNPVIKPKLEKVKQEEQNLNLQKLIDDALAGEEIIYIKRGE